MLTETKRRLAKTMLTFETYMYIYIIYLLSRVFRGKFTVRFTATLLSKNGVYRGKR